jgi:hypothetical protein
MMVQPLVSNQFVNLLVQLLELVAEFTLLRIPCEYTYRVPLKFAGILISNLAPLPSVPVQVSTFVAALVQVRSAACATDGTVTVNTATSADEIRATKPFLTNVFFISYLVSRSLELIYGQRLTL